MSIYGGADTASYNKGNYGLKNTQALFTPEIDLKETLHRVWHRKSLVIGTMVMVVVLVTIVLFQIPPKYYAEALLMLDSRRPNVVDFEAVISGLTPDSGTIFNEIEVIKSRGLVGKLVQRLNLEKVPELNPNYGNNIEPASAKVGSKMEYLDSKRPQNQFALTKGEVQAQLKAAIVDRVLTRLTVEPRGLSRVISIGFTSTDPKLAANIVNTLTDIYIVEQLEVKFNATERATMWLNERVSGLREKVLHSERQVEEFRSTSGLLKGQSVPLITQQMVELHSQFVSAEADYLSAKGRLRHVQNVAKKNNGGIIPVSEVLNSPVIQRLRDQQSIVERRAAELSVEYGKRHPKMINIAADLEEIKKNIDLEVGKIIEGLQNRTREAKARRDTIKKSLDDVKDQVTAANRSEVQLRALEREANADRVMLDAFLSRFRETTAQEDSEVLTPDARVISSADIPVAPTAPKKRLFVALAVVGGLAIGLVLAFAVEYLDSGFRTAQQMENLLEIPVFGYIPKLGKRASAPPDYVLENPASEFGEAIRFIHTGLLLASGEKTAKTVAVSSAIPEEGKTAIAIALTRLLSMGGHNVILVDADLRQPSVQNALAIDSHKGLADYLSGEENLDELIQIDQPSGAHILAAGAATKNSTDLISSAKLPTLLKELSERFEFVILDTPPLIPVSDMRIMARLIEATVFLAKWGSTKRELSLHALKLLENSGATVAGAVLTMVDMRQRSRYNLKDPYYYYAEETAYTAPVS